MMLNYAFLIFVLKHNYCYSEMLSSEKTLVFGPGLNADIVLPVRYMYIQAVDTNGKNFTHSPGKKAFSFKFTGDATQMWIRSWREILDRNDGSFILRFRLYESYKDLTLEIKHDNQHVADSPYVLKGDNYHEKCYCPEHDISKWNRKMSCHDSYKQIDDNFNEFPEIDLNFIREEGKRRFAQETAICHYSIIDNEIYRKCYGNIVGFSYMSDDWFLSLARKVHLPDMEFWFNLGDYPRSKKRNKPFPVISWGSSNDSFDIIIPTYDLTKSVLEALGRVTLDMFSVQGNTGPQWENKIGKGFFRGRDSREERLKLIILGRNNSKQFDVGLTNFFFFKYDEEKYGPKKSHTSFFNFFQYKYQLNIDGTVAAYRLPYLLVGDAVVFKQDSPYHEHFYSETEPWKHFIPFKRDLSDLQERISWAQSNDDIAKKIGLAGQTYARDNLMSDKLYCYTLRVLNEYAKRQKEKPKKYEDMEHIKHEFASDARCNCNKMSTKIKQKIYDEL